MTLLPIAVSHMVTDMKKATAMAMDTAMDMATDMGTAMDMATDHMAIVTIYKTVKSRLRKAADNYWQLLKYKHNSTHEC